MSTEMTQVNGAAAAQPAAEQPKTDTPANTAAPTAPAEPAAVSETPWLEEETLGLSNRTWCEILGVAAAAATGYFVGKYMTNKNSEAPTV